MIYLCLGMTKSASTLVYQLTEEILCQAGRHPLILPASLQPLTATTNYFDTVDETLIAAVRAAAGARDVVLKSHQRPSPGVMRMIATGEIPTSYAIRDPREIALSMIDHGARSRQQGKRPFSECETFRDCLPSIDFQLEGFERTRAAADALVLPYNLTCFATVRAVSRIAALVGARIDPAKVARVFAAGRLSQEFNKGVPMRHHEMDADVSALFLERYAAFYSTIDLAVECAQTAAPRPVRAMRLQGRLRQEVIEARRWVRGRLGVPL
jgi:hypothetical protein